MSDYNVRLSRAGDEPELKALWREVFGDGDELIDAFFSLLYSPGTAAVAVKDGAIISGGYALSGARCRGESCAYIYAMATFPAHRGLGAATAVARALRDAAFSGGAEILATLPATQPLCEWYADIPGMRPAFAKGGAGAEFPESWRRFAEACGEHDPQTPARLYAARADGGGVSGLLSIGWECTLD